MRKEVGKAQIEVRGGGIHLIQKSQPDTNGSTGPHLK